MMLVGHGQHGHRLDEEASLLLRRNDQASFQLLFLGFLQSLSVSKSVSQPEGSVLEDLIED